MSEHAGVAAACPSPCIGVCRLLPGERVCEGCFRTVHEIGEWSAASEERRREIRAAAADRRSARGASRPQG